VTGLDIAEIPLKPINTQNRIRAYMENITLTKSDVILTAVNFNHRCKKSSNKNLKNVKNEKT